MAERSNKTSGAVSEVLQPKVLEGINGELPSGERPKSAAVTPAAARAAAQGAILGATEANHELAKALRSLSK